jgi:hypothetical protein
MSTAIANGMTSLTDEPSVSSNGSDLFFTGNFYAGLSTDSGNTFAFINPAATFPQSDGGFCCDQRTIYVPSSNLTAWSLLYAGDSSGNNEVRLAVARGQVGLASSTWYYWDFTFPSTTVPWPTVLGFDYPQLAYSSNYLYLTTNLTDSNGAPQFAVIYRCALSDLATLPSGSGLSCVVFWLQGVDTFTPADGATSTMYWADHVDNANLEVFSWPESGPDYTSVGGTQVTHSAFPSGPHTCPSPDGTDMCAADDWTIRGGWVSASGQVIGFLWDASQGSGDLGSFPYPYVHAAEFDIGNNLSLIDEPIIWSSTTAYAYPGSGVDGRGGVGLSVAYGGGPYYPGSAMMVRDDVSPTAWETLNVQSGRDGPPGGRWGDYLTARATSGNGNSWLGGGFVALGPCGDNFAVCSSVQPHFYWFGRQRDNPCQQLCVQWVSQPTPGLIQVNSTSNIITTVVNTGSQTWSVGGPNPVHLSYHWLDTNDRVISEGIRSYLPSDIPPGGTATLIGQLVAPASPGSYILEWGFVQEGVGWFDSVGAQDNVFPVVVVTNPVRETLLPIVGNGG